MVLYFLWHGYNKYSTRGQAVSAMAVVAVVLVEAVVLPTLIRSPRCRRPLLTTLIPSWGAE